MTSAVGRDHSAPRRLIVVGIAIALFVAVTACSSTSHTADAFCRKLEEVTGPEGVEVALAPGDPERLNGLVAELNELLDRAPDDISTATATLVDFFEQYQRAPRDERRDLLAENERTFRAASEELDHYALDQCGLFLQRAAPTSVPTADPGVEIAPE